MITPKKRVMTALNNGFTDKVPFTVYENMIPQCETERDLRNRGLCIVKRLPSYTIHHPNVEVKTYGYLDENKRNVVRTVYTTPYGQLHKLAQAGINTTWTLEHLFKTPDDYKSLLFYIEDSVVVPEYDRVQTQVLRLGEDFVVRDQIILEPMQALISDYMGPETFSYEWADNQDEILKLFKSLSKLAMEVSVVVADGPLEFANFGGNVVPQIVGVENFKKYYVPVYNEAAEILHKKNKLIGCHFDADNTLIMGAISDTALDYIEAYDAGISPSVSVARKAWPDKILWLNWPSAWHLGTTKDVYNNTLGLIEEASPGNGFIIGITEDVPEELWQKNYVAIMDGIDAAGTFT